MSRHEVRQARRALKAAGCTCCAQITPLAAEHVAAVGARSGAVIQHQPGCALGDRLIPANKAGKVPAFISRGCGR